MIILDFIGLLLLKKCLNTVFAKVSYLSAGILNEESDFSPVLDIFNKVRQIPMNSY